MTNYLFIENNNAVINNIINIMEDFPEFNCVGYSNSYEESMDIVLREMPDLIFINIDTINENPFGLVNELHQYLKGDTEFIAISTSKEKTYEAIKMGFFDYLLNPITSLDIRKCIIRFKKKHPIKTKKTICLKSYKDYQYLNIDEILFLRADNNTTDFHMDDGSIISAFKTLKVFESILPDNFLRIHKSYIINSNYVSRVSYGNSICTIKKCNHNVPFTKTYKNNIEFMINSLLSTTSGNGLN
ncbi:LytTR family transcriptional regulator DNA-binding domain-containing protein [Flavivirga aquimarina]|uniref:LytTR family transcriptional regulator DNA-binding domain-containing protein n=1 Tax=Flavivirga aquimarina TaxID=2027862 RepID=A0ABT8W7B1_9FLAO|nr:LytTR family transcriptional regulator DNA-binding domain-containing protein [Flavivirga aquimarina]MDO5968986.1 LytTR family transcriptional regulator DNA-binding domain-containing protein [Flavivirga aquimarina]